MRTRPPLAALALLTACSPASTPALDGGSDAGSGPVVSELNGTFGFDVKASYRVLNRMLLFGDGGLDVYRRAQFVMASRRLTNYCTAVGEPGLVEFFVVEVQIDDGGTVGPGVYPVTSADPSASNSIYRSRVVVEDAGYRQVYPFFFADAGEIRISTLDFDGGTATFSARFFFADGGVSDVDGAFSGGSLLCE